MRDEPAKGSPGGSAQAGVRGLWLFVGLILLGLAGACVAVLLGVGRGAAPPFLQRRTGGQGHAVKAAAIQRGDSLSLAGSGTNLPLTRTLVEAFRARHPGIRVVVHESIGSQGGIRATRDGVIDLGLISRPLTQRELAWRLQVVPYARVAVVIAANPTVSEERLTGEALLDIYRGKRSRWRDGERIEVLQRERGDSNHWAVNRALPGFAEVNDQARARRRWRIIYHDRAMREALLATPGAVGLFNLGAIVTHRLPLKIQSYGGLRPTAADPVPEGYPFRTDLALVAKGPLRKNALALIRFIGSPEGAAIMRRNGYLPIGRVTP